MHIFVYIQAQMFAHSTNLSYVTYTYRSVVIAVFITDIILSFVVSREKPFHNTRTVFGTVFPCTFLYLFFLHPPFLPYSPFSFFVYVSVGICIYLSFFFCHNLREAVGGREEAIRQCIWRIVRNFYQRNFRAVYPQSREGTPALSLAHLQILYFSLLSAAEVGSCSYRPIPSSKTSLLPRRNKL